jgi:glycosyltransferase involved in cell wall biosynthesis
MKILYHHRTASRDGQAVHIEEMIHALREAGCEVVVVQPRSTENAAFGADGKASTALRRLLPKPVSELMELAYNWFAYRQLRRAYVEERPDVLYERHNLYLLAGKWLKRRFQIPYLLEVNAPLALERSGNGGLGMPVLARRLEVSVWKSADVLLPVTGVLAELLAASGVSRDRIRVLPNGINLAAFDDAPSAPAAKKLLGLEGKLVLGFAGFVRPWHGLGQVVEFVAESKNHPELVLLVVGDGPARTELVAQAARCGVADQVRFTGIVERSRIVAMLAAFDIALQPAATSYASPLKLFEYLASGRAIVAPRQANITEVLEDGKNALLFDPQDPGALRRTLRRLVNSAALREQLGQAARATVASRQCTWKRNAEAVVQAAQKLLTEQGAVT